jgi:hypothetical protein
MTSIAAGSEAVPIPILCLILFKSYEARLLKRNRLAKSLGKKQWGISDGSGVTIAPILAP